MKLGKVKTRLGLKPSTTRSEVLQALRKFGVDDSMYTLLQEYEIRPHEIWIPLAEELFQRGENSICATFVDEALRHAEVELAALLQYFGLQY